jgi:hypothetical protein
VANQVRGQLHDPYDNGGDQFRELDDGDDDQAPDPAHDIDHLEIIEDPEQQNDHNEKRYQPVEHVVLSWPLGRGRRLMGSRGWERQDDWLAEP